MILSTLPHLSHALAVLSTDIGAVLNEQAEFPAKWADRAQVAEEELAKMPPEQVETFVIGEETEQEQLRPLAPAAHGLLCDAFDGDLSELLFKSLESGNDYLAVEDRADALLAQKLTLQQKKD